MFFCLFFHFRHCILTALDSRVIRPETTSYHRVILEQHDIVRGIVVHAIGGSAAETRETCGVHVCAIVQVEIIIPVTIVSSLKRLRDVHVEHVQHDSFVRWLPNLVVATLEKNDRGRVAGRLDNS